jgi:hypothetical protein
MPLEVKEQRGLNIEDDKNDWEKIQSIETISNKLNSLIELTQSLKNQK